jgi:hypothetical protein
MSTNEEELLKDFKSNRNLLLQYLQARKKEESIVRKKSTRIKDIKENIKRYGLSNKKLTTEDIERLDKEDKRKKKTKTKIKEEVIEETNEQPDLDQENQEPKLKIKKKPKAKK